MHALSYLWKKNACNKYAIAFMFNTAKINEPDLAVLQYIWSTQVK